MNFNEYQVEAHRTAIYPSDKALEYIALGLVGEAGEIANKVKKVLRGDYRSTNADDFGKKMELFLDMEKDLAKELGDVLWYLSEMAYYLGYDLQQIAGDNLMKLHKRQQAGTLQGSGDSR